MATIAEIRQKYPQYSDLSDQQLADSLHSRFYSDIPQDKFYSQIGLSVKKDPRVVNETDALANFKEPIREAFDNIKGDIKAGRGSSVADLAGLFLSPVAGAANVVTKPVAQGLVTAGLPVYKNDKFLKRPTELKGDAAVKSLNAQLGTGLSLMMPARGAVGLRGPAVPQKSVTKLTEAERAIKRLTRGQKLQDALAKKNEFEAVGITPSPLDFLDEAAHGRVAAAAARQTPARQKVQTAVDAARRDFPERMSGQVRRTISDNPQELEETVEILRDVQQKTAAEKYAEPYAQEIEFPPEVLEALNSDSGRKALDQSWTVANERLGDKQTAAELAKLQRAMQEQTQVNVPQHRQDVQPKPNRGLHNLAEPSYQPITGTMTTKSVGVPNRDGGLYNLAEPAKVRGPARILDRIQIALRQRAENLLKGENADKALAGAVKGRRKVINTALDNVDGLKEARAAFRRQEQIIGATEQAPNVLKVGSDPDIMKSTATLGPEELEPSRRVLSRVLQRQLGNSFSAAPGVADRFMAPEVQRRINAFAGDGGPNMAGDLAVASKLELERLRNLQQVSPRRFGAQAAVAEQDMVTEAGQTIGDIAAGAGAIVTGRPVAATVSGLRLWARNLGMSDKQAELLATVAIDRSPETTRQVLRVLSGQYGPAKALDLINQARLVAATNAATATNNKD